MKILRSQKELASELYSREQALAFVPTMGALHAGHLSLIDIAKNHAPLVIASIFVNPTQFGPNEDFDNYPRTIDDDIAKLESEGTDYLFLPSVEEIYPNGQEITHHADKDLANRLCGLNRPGHFDGVCTVVYKLFDLVKPDFAIFGEKDYQQLMIIKDLVTKEKLELEIIPAPILREADGLAMSSRNAYLSPEDRLKAVSLNKVLRSLVSGESDFSEAKNFLLDQGFELDYLERAWDRIFVAASLGKTRLIDNMSF